MYDEAAVSKVLLKMTGWRSWPRWAGGWRGSAELTPESIEAMLRGLAEERQVGSGQGRPAAAGGDYGNDDQPADF
jgi:hypothetical protein